METENNDFAVAGPMARNMLIVICKIWSFGNGRSIYIHLAKVVDCSERGAIGSCLDDKNEDCTCCGNHNVAYNINAT